MTWAFVDRGAAAVIQSRPIWTDSPHGNSVEVVPLRTCCSHTSVGQESERLTPGAGRCGSLRPSMIHVATFPVCLPCPSCLEPMG